MIGMLPDRAPMLKVVCFKRVWAAQTQPVTTENVSGKSTQQNLTAKQRLVLIAMQRRRDLSSMKQARKVQRRYVLRRKLREK